MHSFAGAPEAPRTPLASLLCKPDLETMTLWFSFSFHLLSTPSISNIEPELGSQWSLNTVAGRKKENVFEDNDK